MEGMELVAFNIISHVGTAKSLVMEALYAARDGKFSEAEAKLKESKDYLSLGHHAHFDLIQKEAAGEQLSLSLLMMHAEDQMMSVETITDLVKEMIYMHKELATVKSTVNSQTS